MKRDDPGSLRRLAAAVVLQAVADLNCRDPAIRLDAEKFLADGRLQTWCKLAGIDVNINPDMVSENINLHLQEKKS